MITEVKLVIGKERFDMTIDTNNSCSITAPFPVLLAHIRSIEILVSTTEIYLDAINYVLC